jgi:hypothetical protein
MNILPHAEISDSSVLPMADGCAAVSSPLPKGETAATLSSTPVSSASGDEPLTGSQAVAAVSRVDNDDTAATATNSLDFEAEVAALEVEWLRAGIIMNATALRVIAINDSISKSVSAGA